MTTIERREAGGKRERLTEAARTLFYQQGVHRTTLADIAQEAEVPLGNVYYHFRTKEALIEAVIEAHLSEIQANFAEWERNPDPYSRLVSYIQAGLAIAELVSLYGCPRGSLCQELDKGNDPLAEKAKEIFDCQLQWVEQQFRLLGKGDEAADLAVDLMSSLQGASLLTNSFHSPELLKRQLARLETWLATVA